MVWAIGWLAAEEMQAFVCRGRRGLSRITSPKALREGKQPSCEEKPWRLLEVMVRMVLVIFSCNVIAECRSGKEASLCVIQDSASNRFVLLRVTLLNCR